MPREIGKAVRAEQERYEKRLKKVREEADLVMRGFGEEQATRRAQQKRVQEREQEYETKLAELQKSLEREREDMRGLNLALNERNKSLKLYRSKVSFDIR